MSSHTISKFLCVAIAASPLLLSGCGQGDWEPTRVKGMVPYTLERTAGTGVAYVRAKMMPQKELKLEPAPAPMTTPPPAPPPPPPMSTPPAKAEEVFRNSQTK